MIREAVVEDIPKIIELMKSESEFWNEDWRNDVLEQGIKSANGLAFVYEETGQIVGFVCAHDVGFRAYLSELIIASCIRNKGIGRKLVQYVEHKLISRGCDVLISDVWKDAVGFYESLGWSPPDVVLLRKKLR